MSARSRKIAHLVIGISVIGTTAGCATPKQDSSAITRRASPTRPPVRDVELESAPEVRRFLAVAATPAAGRVRLASHGSEVEEDESASAGLSSSANRSEPAADVSTSPQSIGSAETTHPIDLPTVLELTSGRNPQVAFARARIDEAFAQLDRAQVRSEERV